jgi:hypothetical protein
VFHQIVQNALKLVHKLLDNIRRRVFNFIESVREVDLELMTGSAAFVVVTEMRTD